MTLREWASDEATSVPQIWVHPARKPVYMENTPFHRIDTVGMAVHVVAQAARMGIKGMRSHHQHLRFAQSQSPDLVPGRLAGQIALSQVQNHKMPPIHLGLHAGNEQNTPFPGISERLWDRANLTMPRHGNRVETHLFGSVDVLKQGVSQVSINRVTLTMAMQFDAIGRHKV